MRISITFTSTMSQEIITLLNDYSKKMKIPKSQLISIAIKKLN
jgi:hypothetical protein